MNIAVFVSGNGTNLQAIIDAVKNGQIKASIALIVCDNPKAYALTRSEEAGLENYVFNPADHKNKESCEAEIIKKLLGKNVKLIILAGYMRVLSTKFVEKFKNKIINIHPALLPSFKGVHGIKDAFLYGVKKTGVTVHFVDDRVDNGPIILQDTIEIEKNDTEDSLEKKIHGLEHKLYPKAISLFVDGKLEVEGRRVKIKE